jgi:hypothetical protein
MKRQPAKLVLASGVIVVGLAVVVAITLTVTDDGSGHSSEVVRADTPTSTTATSAATTPGTRVGRADAVATVRRLTLEVPPTATLAAKLVTWGDLRTKGNLGWVANTPDSQELWAVSITGGGIRPEFAGGQTYAWAVAQVDVETGQVVGMSAGPASDGPEAPYFASLTDLSPAS